MAKQEANKKQEGKAQDAEKKSAPSVAPKNYTPRLKAKYNSEIVSNLQKEFGFKSPMRVPRLKKIALNQGVGDAVSDRKVIESALNEMATITGQKPMATLSKKDISNNFSLS